MDTPHTPHPHAPTPATGPIASAFDDLEDVRIRRYGTRVERLDWLGRDGFSYCARYHETDGDVYLRVSRWDAEQTDEDEDTTWDLPVNTPLLALLAQGMGVTNVTSVPSCVDAPTVF